MLTFHVLGRLLQHRVPYVPHSLIYLCQAVKAAHADYLNLYGFHYITLILQTMHFHQDDIRVFLK